jgi:hypothetical protein
MDKDSVTSINCLLIEERPVKNQLSNQADFVTPSIFLPMTSLITKSTISMRAMTINWSGEVFPMTTPNEMRTVAAAKSLSNILERK